MSTQFSRRSGKGRMRVAAGVAAALMVGGFAVSVAEAQIAERNKAWKAGPRNPANSAVLMQNQERNSQNQNQAGGVAAGPPANTILCGGGAGNTAGAAANVSCILVGDNTIANINTGQHSAGDQTATSETHSTVAEQVENILQGTP